MAEHRRSNPRRVQAGLGGILALLVVAAGSVSTSPTAASWNDSEWASASLGTVQCQAVPSPSGAFSTKAAGKLFDGLLASTDLDTLASVNAVTVQNSGTAVEYAPPSARRIDDYTYANALSSTALGAIDVDPGRLLVLPLGTSAGTLNQFGQAYGDGRSLGAAGFVNDSGAIQTTTAPTGSEPPTLARVELGQILGTLLGNGLGGGISGLADASLSIGAVSSQASYDACNALWSNDVYANLTRKYLIAALDLTLTTRAIGAMTSEQQGILSSARSQVEALGSHAGVSLSVKSEVQGLLAPLVLGAAADITGVTLDSATISLNLAPVEALLAEPITDGPGGIVSIDLEAGTTTIDLEALIGPAFGTTGLNGLDPNTRLLVDAEVVGDLEAAVTTATETRAANLAASLIAAIQGAMVSATVAVELPVGLPLAGLPLLGLPLATTIVLTIPESSLVELQAGSVAATAAVAPVGSDLSALLVPLKSGVGKILGNALAEAALGRTGVIPTTTASIEDAGLPLVTSIGSSTSALFGEPGLLRLTANAQNKPAPPVDASLAPDDWTTAPGQFDVAALRLTAVGEAFAGSSLSLNFARSSVGPNLLVRQP
jgi:predicted ribosomally synthesized peptide with SipW-like signal peptide